ESVPAVLREDVEALADVTLAGLAEPDAAGDPPAHVVRRILGVDRRRGAVLVGDEVVPGSRFAVVVRDREVARRALEASIEEILAAGSADGSALAGALCFNDIERSEALYGIEDLDAAYLRSRLGALPFAGFFSSLELAPMAGRNRFH